MMSIFRSIFLLLAVLLSAAHPSPGRAADPVLLTIDSDGGPGSTAFTRAMLYRLPHVRLRTATLWNHRIPNSKVY
jgi:hypothetical protein